MKTTLMLTTLLLGALALAPTGQAETALDSEKCYTVYDFPDLGWKVCYNLDDPNCTVYEYRTTIIGTEKSCIYPSGSAASQSSAGGIPWPGGQTPDVQCMDVYSETYLANGYWLVRRDSCSAQVYWCPEGSNPPAPPCQEAGLLQASTAGTAGCYMVYSRTDVGTYSIVRRTSCSPPEFYQCPYEGAPIEQCHGLLELAAASSAGIPWPGGQTPDLQCMDVYSETHLVGPYWLVRRDSCSAQVYECPDGYSPPAPPCREAQLLRPEAALPTVPPMNCADIYARHEVGPVALVMTSGCSGHVETCDDRVEPRSIDLSCLVATTSASSEPMCMYYYYEVGAGPVTYVQRDSCHSETYACEDGDGVHESDETLKAFVNSQAASPDPAAVQDCVTDTVDDYVALG